MQAKPHHHYLFAATILLIFIISTFPCYRKRPACGRVLNNRLVGLAYLSSCISPQAGRLPEREILNLKLVNQADVDMRKFILILIFCALTITVNAQKPIYKLPANTVSCGGFVVSLSTADDKVFPDSTVIYGKVIDCISKDEAYALIIVLNDANKRVDSLYTDKYGNYKKRIYAGTYKLRALNPAYGSIDTQFIDFFPKTSVEIDLYLSAGPAIKD